MVDLKEIKDEELLTKCEQNLLIRNEAIHQEFSNNKKIIDFNNSQINDIDASIISASLKENAKKIEIFQMSNNNFTDIGLIDILSNLQWATNIKELYFGNNENLTEVGMSALIEVLPVFKNLKILGLNNCGLNDENIILFSYCLEDLPNLEIMFLNNNEISDNGLICLGLAINEKTKKIKVLYLGGNYFTEFGLKNFFESTKTNPTLCCLTLNGMEMNENVALHINKFLTKNTYLEDLNLSSCSISNSMIKTLKYGLSLNSTLKTLHLNDNEITDEGAWEIFTLLQEFNETLTFINLEGNEIDDSIIDEIQDLLKQNKAFQRNLPVKTKPKENLEENPSDPEEEKEDEKEMELYESMIEEQRQEITQSYHESLNKLKTKK